MTVLDHNIYKLLILHSYRYINPFKSCLNIKLYGLQYGNFYELFIKDNKTETGM